MQVIIGGAYNGKTAYVKQQLQGQQAIWYDGEIPLTADADCIVLTGLDQLVMQGTDELVVAQAIYARIGQLDAQVICICTDIGRGIVPMDKEQRFMRDALGRLYQLLMQEASAVTRIWYGLAETLK